MMSRRWIWCHTVAHLPVHEASRSLRVAEPAPADVGYCPGPDVVYCPVGVVYLAAVGYCPVVVYCLVVGY